MKSQTERSRLIDLAQELSRLPYEDIEDRLNAIDDDSLVVLLNSRSRKVGDIAYEVLGHRTGAAALVRDAILRRRLTRRDGKIRATNFLCRLGRSFSDSIDAYRYFLADKNYEVADNALFGLVFFQDTDEIALLRSRRDELAAADPLRERFDTAIESLERQDPFLFSPYFHDAADVWELDRTRFADRIGSL